METHRLAGVGDEADRVEVGVGVTELIAGAEQRDRLERLNHADDRAEQTEQRRHDRDHLDEQDAALQPPRQAESRSELGATQMQGAETIRDFYANVKTYIKEEVTCTEYVANDTTVAVEIPTRFECIRDWEDSFWGVPLKKGQVMRIISFGFIF